ncbi:MAG TPA: phenylalanine--tRNA ligase subunit alpha [Mycoplasmatales bacterium]|jgi:phenylalanyl-tRNA synthetase alpha chain|nr:phenylalanine--tRNA ligase subunit alpha [Mycoplasmatales bacterium]
MSYKNENEKFKEISNKSYLEFNSIKNLEEFKQFEKKYFKSKGNIFSSFLLTLKTLKGEDKVEFGRKINDWKVKILRDLNSKKLKLEIKKEETIENNYLIGVNNPIGGFHPIKKVIFEIYDYFISKGYKVFECEEIDDKWNNFDGLNLGKNHPAKSWSDTFYLSNDSNLLLRTHASNFQIRAMRRSINKNIMVVSSGKVYRKDEDDPTHSHQYTNFEIINISKNVSFANLKWCLEDFFQWFFKLSTIKIRFRPSFFPFTEPSFEVDISCIKCNVNGINCSVCKNTKWIEILGAGLIHPKVLKNGGFNEKKFSGFAAGIGIERILMIKHGIKDIREFYSNDFRFLKQTTWS